MATLCILIGVVIPLTPAIAYAGGMNVPINDDFYKPKEGPKPEEQKPINDENTKVENKDKKESKKDGPSDWAVTKFVINDFIKESAASIEPFIYNELRYNAVTGQWENPSPGNVVYTRLIKIPRSMLGNLVFKDGSYGKIAIDTWDGAEKSKDAWNRIKTLREINKLQEEYRATTSLFQKAEIQKKLGSLKTVSKFSKGIAGVGIFVGSIDAGINLFDAYNKWKAGKGDEARDSIIKAVGSVGDIMMSTGALLGFTPMGVGLAAAGAVLWIGSAAWTHREGIKKMAKGVVNGVKKGYNAVKSAWNKLFG